MPLNNGRFRGSMPSRPTTQCENPDCTKTPLPGKRYCSMCLALVQSNQGALPPPPPEEPKKNDEPKSDE